MWTKTRRKYQRIDLFNDPFEHLICYLFIVSVVIFKCECAKFEDIQKEINITECEALGFKGATKNACGYCVGGKTNLPKDYGKDCKGKCGGNTIFDCNNECGGTAYIDECTNECVGGNTGETEDLSKKDCSHACFGTTPYRVGSCGHCAIGGQRSPLEDCASNCYSPNEYQQMAKYVCDQCVGGKTNIPESEVKDMCGNCKKDQIPCLCNGTNTVDICGICDGKNDTCFKIVKFEPDVIPSKVLVKIKIVGAFMGKKKDVSCLFKSSETNTEESTFGQIKESFLICNIKLSAGTYYIGVNISDEREPLFADNTLIVYDKDLIEVTSMSPITFPYNNEAKKVTVNFQGNYFPDRPIICFIIGKDWPKSLKKITGEKYWCEIPLPKTSQNVTIIPSFNEIHELKEQFIFSFVSPQLQFAQGTSMSEDKTAIIITFDRPVDVCELKTCSDVLTEETSESLGKEIKCYWPTKQQLVIKIPHPIQDNRFRVSFKPDVLREDKQNVAEYKTDDLSKDVGVKPQSTVALVVVIFGPNIVPMCGTFFLIGYFSSSGEKYSLRWEVERSDRQYVKPELSELVTNTQTTTLTLNAELLETDVDYTFTLFISTESQMSARKAHTLRKKNYYAPLVILISIPVPFSPVLHDKTILIFVIIILPECVTKFGLIFILWSVDNPKIKCDFGSIASSVYVIKPNTLPEDTTVTFTVKAFMGSAINEYSESSVTFRIEPAQLKANIEGSSERTVGIENGVIELDGSKSEIPIGLSAVYHWSCEDENQQPCYDYSQDSKDMLLITKKKRTGPILQFHSNSLKVGQKLKFGLKVHSNNQNSETANVIIDVINGSIPMITLKSVVSAGVVIQKPNSESGAYFVPAGAYVIICADVNPGKYKLKSVSWDVIGSTRPFTYSVLEGRTCLTLGEGYLIEHGVYRIEVKACDNMKSCGGMTISLYATPHVSSCKVAFKQYTACKWTTAIVSGCIISPDRLPLMYQVIVYSGSNYKPITAPEFTDDLKFIGPPPPPNENKALLGILVCDRFNKCKNFSGDPVQVKTGTNHEKSLKAVVKSAKFIRDAGNPLKALCLFLCFSLDNNTNFTKEQLEDIVEYTSESIKEYPTFSHVSSQISALHSCILPLCNHEETVYKTKCLTAIQKSTEKATSLKAYLETSIISQSYEMVTSYLTSSEANIKLLQAAKKAQVALLAHSAAFLPLGSKIQFGSGKKGTPFSVLYHKYIDQNPLQLRTNINTGSLLSSVSFGKKVIEKFIDWDCGEETQCNGAVISMSVYPDKDPYMLENDKQLSPVVDISLLAPGNGKVVKIENVENEIKIKLALKTDKKMKKDIDLYCYYWDEDSQKWDSDRVMTFGADSGIMQCWVSHLSSFVVLETNKGLSTASIAGIVVATLMAVFIICVVVLFFVHKKQNKEIRVSTEGLQTVDEK